MGRDPTVHDVAVVRLYLWFDDFHIDDFTPQTDDFPHQTAGDSTDVLEFIPSDLPDIGEADVIPATDVTADDATPTVLEPEVRDTFASSEPILT